MFKDRGWRVDPVTLGAVLLAVATGVSEALGGQLWVGVVSLVRRPVAPEGRPPADDAAAVPRGRRSWRRCSRPRVIGRRRWRWRRCCWPGPVPTTEFEQALESWWEQAEPVRASIGNVTNTISGGTQHGPVLQGRDFSNLTFGAAPARRLPPEDPDAG